MQEFAPNGATQRAEHTDPFAPVGLSIGVGGTAAPRAATRRRCHVPRPGAPAEDPSEPGEGGFPVPPEMPDGPPPAVDDPDPADPHPVREPSSTPAPIIASRPPPLRPGRARPSRRAAGARAGVRRRPRG